MKKLPEVIKTAEKVTLYFICGEFWPKEVSKKHKDQLAEAFSSKRGRFEWEQDSIVRKLIELGY